ncbi:lipoprotein [Allomuricauda ruestringensis DSM 13258]|uniref:Lipoprotein n=1 Tax=Allomuricauda ruestringensis (strain DSM 13258 / CIP 107369 / LMG 19739 / B1) TaxID=886377 RepID=G2PQZ0_ALLRU|nr:BspA family leucine-rich repeat surface protein [Allomuricauda ruestringensis]AEM69154.1 lipoprotein [Allomuricauda ruestringensis DSM 13258]
MNTKNLFLAIISLVFLWSCGKEESPVEVKTNSLADDLDSFVTIWKTVNKNDMISIGTNDEVEQIFDYTIDWGDGTIENLKNGNPAHTYKDVGVYTVAIKGKFPSIKIDRFLTNIYYASYLISLEQWGANQWESLESAFENCKNLEYNAMDAPGLTKITTIRNMFKRAGKFSGANLNDWNVSNITDMESVFHGTRSDKLTVDKWDVKNVVNMKGLFSYSSFNGDISEWDVGKVESMNSMFNGADLFNQNLNNWNVSSVKDMTLMFSDAEAFDKDISEWNVGNVMYMGGMFQFSESFNRDLADWNINNVINMHHMLEGSGMSPENYGNTLVGWLNTGVQHDITLGASGLSYCINDEVEFARGALESVYGWYLWDNGGVDCKL